MTAMDKNKSRIEGVIFDLDGTLIDSIPVMFMMLNMAFARLGLPRVSREEAALAGRDGYFDWSLVLPPMNKARIEATVSKASAIIAEIQPRIMRQEAKLISGAAPMLEKISSLGMQIGLVTTTQTVFLDHKMFHLRRAGIDRLFETIITVDDVRERKPAPEPLILCAKNLGIPVEKTAYVGDSRVDIQAGKAAGARTIGVLTGLDDRDALVLEAPDAIVESVAQLENTFLFENAAGPNR